MQFSCEWRMKTKNRPLVADDLKRMGYCIIPEMFRGKIYTERKIGRGEKYSERKIRLISLCWMASNTMNDVLNPNLIWG